MIARGLEEDNVSTSSTALGLLAILSFASSAFAQIKADFESYPEGIVNTAFTDPQSGFRFSSNNVNGSVANFLIDLEDGDSLLPLLHGNWLGNGGLGAGPGISTGSVWPFTITFPIPTQRVTLDALYTPTAGHQLTLAAQNSAGQTLAQSIFELEQGLLPHMAHFSLDSTTPFT